MVEAGNPKKNCPLYPLPWHPLIFQDSGTGRVRVIGIAFHARLEAPEMPLHTNPYPKFQKFRNFYLDAQLDIYMPFFFATRHHPQSSFFNFLFVRGIVGQLYLLQ